MKTILKKYLPYIGILLSLGFIWFFIACFKDVPKHLIGIEFSFTTIALIVLPWIVSFVLLYKKNDIKVWFQNIMIFIILMDFFYAWLYDPVASGGKFATPGTHLVELVAVFLFPIWGVILCVSAFRRKKWGSSCSRINF